MAWDLALAQVAIGLAGCVVVVMFAWVALPIPTALIDNVALLQLLACAAMGAGSALLSIGPWRQSKAMYAHVWRRHRREAIGQLDPVGRLPPDVAVAMFDLPPRGSLGAGLALLTVLVADASSGGAISGLRGMQLFAVSLLTFGVLQSAAMVTSIASRALLWRWLSRVHPRDAPVRRRWFPRLAARLAIRVGSVLTLLGCVALSLPLSYLSAAQELQTHEAVFSFGSAPMAYFAGALAGTVFAIVVGVAAATQLGRQFASDMSDLAHHVEALSRSRSFVDRRPEPQLPHVRTDVATLLAARTALLANKYAALAEREVRARQAIEATQRLKTRFMAHMSHDLRSPLNSIAGFAEILSDDRAGLNSEQMASVLSIRHSGRNLVLLVTDIVDTARIEAGRLTLHRERCDLRTVLAAAIETAQELDGAGTLEVHLELAPDAPAAFWFDGARVEQAIGGVLSHVVRMSTPGVIQVQAKGRPDGLEVEVVAEQLPPEDTQRMFLAFRELKQASGRRVGGLGLGLSLARSLVEAHGGELRYDSSESRFTFFFPTLEEPEVPEPPAA